MDNQVSLSTAMTERKFLGWKCQMKILQRYERNLVQGANANFKRAKRIIHEALLAHHIVEEGDNLSVNAGEIQI